MASEGERLARVETKLEHIEKHFDERFTRIENLLGEIIEEKKDDHDKFNIRINRLENWQTKFVAKFSVYSAIAIGIGGLFGNVGLELMKSYLGV